MLAFRLFDFLLLAFDPEGIFALILWQKIRLLFQQTHLLFETVTKHFQFAFLFGANLFRRQSQIGILLLFSPFNLLLLRPTECLQFGIVAA